MVIDQQIMHGREIHKPKSNIQLTT